LAKMLCLPAESALPRPPDAADVTARVHGLGRSAGLAAARAVHHPLKIFSYMASGRPIVATDLPTHTEVLDADAAILVPPTPAVLAEGILRALDDPAAAAALGQRARHVVETRYTFAGFKQHLADCYAAVLGPTTTMGCPSGKAERRAQG
jgi:glycosyltransferase involved in cell wall biosynthesis